MCNIPASESFSWLPDAIFLRVARAKPRLLETHACAQVQKCRQLRRRSAPLFLGVDVGTGSARAALFTEEGARLTIARRNIEKWSNPEFPGGSWDQSTEDMCAAVQVINNNQCDLTSVNSRLISDLISTHAKRALSFPPLEIPKSEQTQHRALRKT